MKYSTLILGMATTLAFQAGCAAIAGIDNLQVVEGDADHPADSTTDTRGEAAIPKGDTSGDTVGDSTTPEDTRIGPGSDTAGEETFRPADATPADSVAVDAIAPDTNADSPKSRVCEPPDKKCSVGATGAVASVCTGEGQWSDTKCPYDACDTVNRTCRVYTNVTSDGYTACGVRSDGSASCWADIYDRVAATPAGPFSSMTANQWGGCGLRQDGSLICWSGFTGTGPDRPNWVSGTPLDKGYSSVSMGDFFMSCALKGTAVTCWGSTNYGEAIPTFNGTYSAMGRGSSSRAFCAITTAGTLECQGYYGGSGDQAAAPPYTPSGTFTAVAVADYDACALRKSDGAVTCFGMGLGSATSPEHPQAPTGPFVEIAASIYNFCARRSDGTVACWTYPRITSSQFGAPSTTEKFLSISGDCGVRTDGSVTCWLPGIASPTQ